MAVINGSIVALEVAHSANNEMIFGAVVGTEEHGGREYWNYSKKGPQ